ncbi:hypothetical protein HIM_03487 [Hirsutella minnesotensis 3608]|uniref:Zn(2)-C6 fungal-type domain-containing protein n=1 Tax=Hirsutella minnesotensis 3608 TaxID=1043627 RepID=A0A0F7ZME3_9HYPO|nr:hypothetical protein HIM_03487 [Hirsutella minnesotensis 3608]
MVKPDPDGPATETALPTRQRKWHPRVFTGCVNCRRRHVKCDERTPSCTNCSRLNLPCNFDRRFVFKAVRPSSKSPATKRRSSAQGDASASSSSASPSSNDDPADDVVSRDQPPAGQMVVAASGSGSGSGSGSSSTTLPQHRAPPGFEFAVSDVTSSTGSVWGSESPVGVTHPDPNARIDCNDTLYYHHFYHTVSSYLIIYDTAVNSNPYRMLPQLAGSSGLLQDTMKALGAMHLSGLPNVQNQGVHRSAAMKTYGSVVTRLRDAVSSNQGHAGLELLATSLLLCMLEKMSSSDDSWKIHLTGAGQIFQSMYGPRTTAVSGSRMADSPGVAANLPLRRFLVSMMSYLDVAASCATGGGPLVSGDYWETLGGGWEYNLGVPSFATKRSPTDRIMSQLRSSWSRIMSIQTEISRFAELTRNGLDHRQREITRNDIAYRIKNWHESRPDIYLRLREFEGLPDDTSEEEAEVLRAAASIQSYALSCTVYLERSATRRIGGSAFDPHIKAAVDRTLALIANYSSGVHRLAFLWPFLTAGIATVDIEQQRVLRDWLTEMKCFGFRHVSRVLDTLEYSWEQMRLYGGLNYDEFETMIASNLVP